jgi:hypothetical protein
MALLPANAVVVLLIEEDVARIVARGEENLFQDRGDAQFPVGKLG